MRLKKINKAPDSIMRKKCIIASALALGGVAVFGTTTVVTAEVLTPTILKSSDIREIISVDKNNLDFELPGGFGIDDVIAYGKDGTSNYAISKKGVLYFLKGEISVSDTQDIGKKYGNQIKEIQIYNPVKTPVDSTSLFANYFSNVSEIRAWGLDLGQTKNASLMFANMPSLKTIYNLGITFSEENKLTNIHGMFKDDKNLEQLELRDMFGTENVTDMSEMFSGVSKLKELDISGFDMGKVTNSSNMFEKTNLEKITLGINNKFADADVLPNKNNLTWKAVDTESNLEEPDKMFFSSNSVAGKSLSKYYDGNHRRGKHTFRADYRVLIIPSNLGNQIVEGIKGNSMQHVNIDVPIITGYKSDKKTVNAYINYDGTVSTDEKIQYTLTNVIKPNPGNPVGPSKPSSSGNGSSTHSKNKVIKTNVKISTNLGEIEVSVSGKANEKKSVEVPYREGYTADKKTVTVLIKSDGTATTAESVKYTKNNIQIVRNNSLLTTFSDKSNVILYHINGDKLTRSNRLLAPNTDWFSDQQVTIDYVTYLRVATNEWIKATNVYMYESSAQVVRTKGLTALVDTHGKQVKNRALHGETSWFTDRIVMINGKKYYRVATNELVSANDVY